MKQSIVPSVSNRLANMSFVCACLVVSIHVVDTIERGGIAWWVKQLFHGGISRIAVPFFFTAAGYFLAGHMGEKGWWPREIRKRIRSLLVPFVAWNVLWGLYAVPLTIVANACSGDPLLLGLPHGFWRLVGIFGLNPFLGPFLGVLWFVRCLFLLVLVSPFLWFFIRRGRWFGWGLVGVWLVCQTALNCFGPTQEPWYHLTSFFLPPSSLLFFTAGIVLRRWPMEWEGEVWQGSVALMLVFVYMMWQGCVDKHAWPMVQACLGHVVIIIGLWAVWRLMPTNRWPVWLTSCAFPIYVLHPFIAKIWIGTAGQFGIVRQFLGTLSGHLAGWASGIVISMIIALTLRRYFPRVASLLFGNR